MPGRSTRLPARDEVLHALAGEADLIDRPGRDTGVVDRGLAGAVEARLGHVETLDDHRAAGLRTL